jgi:hypothetical protein
MKTVTDSSDAGVSEEFIYKFGALTTSTEYELKVPLIVPHIGDVTELTHRLINTLKLPCYLEPGMYALP